MRLSPLFWPQLVLSELRGMHEVASTETRPWATGVFKTLALEAAPVRPDGAALPGQERHEASGRTRCSEYGNKHCVKQICCSDDDCEGPGNLSSAGQVYRPIVEVLCS